MNGKYMNVIGKRIISICLVLSIIFLGVKGLNYILVDDEQSYTRVMMHEFYNQDNIDVLCVGASHCYQGINPDKVSELTGKKVFNAGSSNQTIDVSFELIKEAARCYDIREVYLEMSASMAMWTGNYKERDSLTNVYIITDYMKNSPEKVRFLLEASGSAYYVNGFFPGLRYRQSVVDVPSVLSIISKKQANTYKRYEYAKLQNEYSRYVGKGFVEKTRSVGEYGFYRPDSDNERIDVSKISSDWEKTLLEIIEFCSHNDILLTLYDSPVSEYQLAAQENYDEYIDYINGIVNGLDVRYAEFNLLRGDYLPFDVNNYEDGHHYNKYGAEVFSTFLAKYMKGEVPESAYYGSVAEKLNDISPRYYGISYVDHEDIQGRTLKLISNRNEYFEYKVEVVVGRNISLIQDYSLNNEVFVPFAVLKDSENNKENVIMVSFRKRGTDAEGIRVEYSMR